MPRKRSKGNMNEAKEETKGIAKETNRKVAEEG
jgi:hypothetical protein